jgi:AcrR family transcriptional regulator
MSPATFYSYFPSKDLALAAALDGILGDLNDAADGALDLERLLDTDLRTVLSGLASAVLDVFRDNLLVFRLALSRLPDSKEIRDVYRRRQSDGLAELRRFLELGRAAGRVRADRDLETLATAVLVTLQGFNNPILLQRRDDDPVVDALVAMLERSLRVEA